MVTIPRWKVAVEDHEGHRSQLGLDPTHGGVLVVLPPHGESFTMSEQQVTACIEQMTAYLLLVKTATGRAMMARQMACAAQGGATGSPATS